jgi:hypothetical protein
MKKHYDTINSKMLLNEARKVRPYARNGCGCSNSSIFYYGIGSVSTGVRITGWGYPQELLNAYGFFHTLSDNWFNNEEYIFRYSKHLENFQNNKER